MAGSYRHVNHKVNSETRFIGATLLDHLGDALEAIEEYWFIVRFISGDDDSKIDAALAEFYSPKSPLAIDLQRRLMVARDNNFWKGTLDEDEGNL